MLQIDEKVAGNALRELHHRSEARIGEPPPIIVEELGEDIGREIGDQTGEIGADVSIP